MAAVKCSLALITWGTQCFYKDLPIMAPLLDVPSSSAPSEAPHQGNRHSVVQRSSWVYPSISTKVRVSNPRYHQHIREWPFPITATWSAARTQAVTSSIFGYFPETLRAFGDRLNGGC